MEKRALTPWSSGLEKSTRAMGSIHEAIDRLFDDWFNGFEMETLPVFEGRRWGTDIPKVDVAEGDKEFKVTAELPGIDEKDIDIEMARDRLIIKAEKKEEKEEKHKNYFRKERSFGAIHREIPLPTEILADKASAEFKKGVLTITLPKSPEAQKELVRIPVKGS